MKKIFIIILLLLLFPGLVLAQENLSNEKLGIPYQESEQVYSDQVFFYGKVLEIKSSGFTEYDNTPFQILIAEVTNGARKGQVVQIAHGVDFAISARQLLDVGDQVVINEVRLGDEVKYYISDSYRLGAVKMMITVFLILVVLFAGFKGLRAVVGLGFSLLVIIYYILPKIVEGGSPIFVALTGSLLIMLVSIYLAHGFHRRTTIALASISITLFITVILAELFIRSAHLFGLGTEDAFFLQNNLVNLDLRGLLLGGIIIGTLGVLDDITTAQVAIVAELKHANSKLTAKDLYERATRIGREHIASLVNTLAMAYVGAALPLMLLITINLKTSITFILNSELLVEEIARTLIGSSALILAVPITTILACVYYGNREVSHQELSEHTHKH